MDINEIKKYLESLTQDELYDLLIECGIKGLEKVEDGKGKIILEEEKENEIYGK